MTEQTPNTEPKRDGAWREWSAIAIGLTLQGLDRSHGEYVAMVARARTSSSDWASGFRQMPSGSCSRQVRPPSRSGVRSEHARLGRKDEHRLTRRAVGAQAPNQRLRRLEPKCSFWATSAADGALNVPVRVGPDRKSMSTLPTRPLPNSM